MHTFSMWNVKTKLKNSTVRRTVASIQNTLTDSHQNNNEFVGERLTPHYLLSSQALLSRCHNYSAFVGQAPPGSCWIVSGPTRSWPPSLETTSNFRCRPPEWFGLGSDLPSGLPGAPRQQLPIIQEANLERNTVHRKTSSTNSTDGP